MRAGRALRVLRVAAALLLAASGPAPGRPATGDPTAGGPEPGAAPPRRCHSNALCFCHSDHFACNYVPFHRFPDTEAEVRHVSVWGARLGALREAALDARRLRTLVLVAARLHHLEPNALSSMTSTLASLDLGHNDFTEIPIEALRELKVLNWLNLQNNYISKIDSQMDWGFMADSLSSLSLSNNQLCVVGAGALSALRRLARLDLGGNRLRALAPGALPLALAALRLADNLLARAPCAALQLPRLRHLHLRNNLLRPEHNHTCHAARTKIDSVDLSRNELDDSFEFDFPNRNQLKQLMLDLNDFTAVPSFVLDSSRLEKLSISYNKLKYISDATTHALKHTLEHLDLDHNDLSVLPQAMREMSRLRQLSVAYNRLEELCCLPPNLHSLSLAGNFLSSLPTGLRDLAPGKLTYLDVGYNRIQAISSEQFGAWAEALATLSLKGNRLAALGASAFPTLLPLRELLLSFNDLYYVDSNAFLNLTALQVLELSSTLFSGEFPIATSIDRLSWLSLDNNNIHFISSRDICNFPSLEYLNLEFNKVIEFPYEISEENSSCPCKLKELRLSYNYVSKINAQFLASFVELQSVDLSNNRMHNVSERSFTNLPNLVYLSLSENVVEYIARRAFHDLPKLEVLDLHQNKLVEFSTEHFENVSNDETNFSVNVSYNKISALNGGRKAFISVLDLSNNMLESLSKDFFDSLGSNIRQLIISNNKLIHVDNFSFGSMPTLDILSLHNNKLSALKKRAFADMPWLQMIDLSRNEVSQLSSEPFQNMARLRHLRLASNELRSLPRDSFKNTVLEYLDLSDNQLTIFPSSALARVGFTLRRLELASNHLEYLDVAMFHGISFLHELNLAGNALTVLSDNTFAGLARLTRLELSHNTIKTNFKELFHNLPRLRRLGLASSNLRSVPNLPLANLTDLDISNNHIFSFRESDVRHLTNLRILDVSRNRLTSLQPAMWVAFLQLATLNVSCNPIVRIASGSFEGLSRLHHLQMDNLWHLETIEPRSFRSLTSLRSLTLESRPRAGRGELSLGDVVSATPALESLTLHVRETVLETQLRGLRAPKLVALEVRGATLAHVEADALTALGAQRALVLRLAGTRVAALPAGLARPLARIPHLALDFSDNRLTAIGPAALYPNLTNWSRLATKLVPGGLVVAGNPLACGCGVSWVGAWLRRWTAEAGGGTRAARAAAARSACRAPGGRARSLLALPADDADCHASALSGRAARAPPARLPPALSILLFHTLAEWTLYNS